MPSITFDNNSTQDLSGLLSTPRDVIELGINICSAVQTSCDEKNFRGSIWPGNITVSGTMPTLGPARGISITSMSPEELEYIAPEQFWNGENWPESDVYSIGLILYTLLNNGFMPFFEQTAEQTAEERAAAMQKRMNGHVPPYPATASRELGDLVLKAIAFKRGDRFSDVSALQAALEALPEGAAVPAAVPIMPMTEEEVKAAKSYKVDKEFEEITPIKPPKKTKKAKKEKIAGTVPEDTDPVEFRKSPRRRWGWVGPFVAAIVAVAVFLFLMRGCEDDNVIAPPSTTPPVTTEAPQITPDITPEVTPSVDEPVETPEVTEEPKEPRYEVIVANLSWEAAKARCEELGGHLATVSSSRELNQIIALVVESGADYIWLGSYRGDDGMWYNVTGEAMTFATWDNNEPSVKDVDGTPEDYLMMWFNDKIGAWLYNDMRNDPITPWPRIFGGKVAFVCQFDD